MPDSSLNVSPNISIVTLGCPKNQADSEGLARLFKEQGIATTNRIEDAAAILINTCGFIEEAKEESIGEILRLAQLKGDRRKLIVFGCLSQRYRQELQSEIPEIDALWGVGQEDLIVDFCKTLVQPENSTAIPAKPTEIIEEKNPPYRYIKIAEGCSRGCTYCVIPSIRGRFEAFTADSILKEAQRMVAAGTKELVLVAQDITSYHWGQGYGLPELVRDMASISGDFWIRLLYLYPTAVTPQLIQAVGEEDKVCKYLDIPLQHSEDRILKAMGRAGSRASYLDLIRTLRQAINGVILRTTLITGFPGESEEDFKGLLSFIEEASFDRLGVFAYSDEEGTAASAIRPKVSRSLKRKRMDEIMHVQADISFERNSAFVGKTFRALIDEMDGEIALARLYSHAPEVDGNVILQQPAKALKGFVSVTITGAGQYDLEAEMAGGCL